MDAYEVISGSPPGGGILAFASSGGPFTPRSRVVFQIAADHGIDPCLVTEGCVSLAGHLLAGGGDLREAVEGWAERPLVPCPADPALELVTAVCVSFARYLLAGGGDLREVLRGWVEMPR